MKIVAVIPARYGSSRFEGKPLADIAGSPMIAWVYKRVARSRKIAEVYVATDDQRIADACQAHGLNYIMTSPDHRSSTARVHEVAEQVQADLYICINGDEPLIDHRDIEAIIPDAAPGEGPYAANLTCRMVAPAEVIDSTNIKVVFDETGRAIFFSRSPIPYPKSALHFDYFKHVGVLAYNKAALDYFVGRPRGPIETVEDINELRFIEGGAPLQMIVVEPSKSLSVDTPKDLREIIDIVREGGLTP